MLKLNECLMKLLQNNYKISFDKWFTEKRLISDLLVQHDIGPAQKLSSLKNIICAHQTSLKTITPKKINIAIFDKLILRKYYFEIGSVTYHRDGVFTKF